MRSAMVSPVDCGLSYRNITGDKVARRLGSLINTAYQASYQLGATAQSPSKDKTALALGLNDTTASEGVGYTTIYTTATTTPTEQVFIANIAWVTVTMAVAVILLLCGVLSMVFRYGTRSPDILGFVSSMTRDDPNFQRIPGGDYLDGLQRARILRHVRVQIVDTRPWDNDGHIQRNLGRSGRR
ncbi:hypothetical protein LTR05_006183 [Lithohypha guttulata]|uniref:Uncharacterized protein n=1 Tax=Lithohypha guttulata TaxID=1690604 RepID=A0AAN7SWV6_9EURO|nr:hypothetical protein LTR05_006183 [Lithohypha guttulata]